MNLYLSICILSYISKTVICQNQPGPWATEMLNLVNGFRAQNGAGNLCLNQDLMEAATAYSNVLQTAPFSHIGPDGSTPITRAQQAGAQFEAIAENIASPDTPQGAFQRLIASPPHRANILDERFNLMGLGGLTEQEEQHTGNWVQTFTKSSDLCLDGSSNGSGGSGNSTTAGTGSENEVDNEGTSQKPYPPPAPGDPPKITPQQWQMVMLQFGGSGQENLVVVRGPTVEINDSGFETGFFDAGYVGCPPCNTYVDRSVEIPAHCNCTQQDPTYSSEAS